MRFFSLSIIGLLLFSSGVNAQQKKSFISPEMAFSRELFPKSDSVQMPRLVMMQQRTVSLPPSPSLNTLPADYNWAKDLRRREAIKDAALERGNYYRFASPEIPDASRDVMQQSLRRSMYNH